MLIHAGRDTLELGSRPSAEAIVLKNQCRLFREQHPYSPSSVFEPLRIGWVGSGFRSGPFVGLIKVSIGGFGYASEF